MVSAPKNRAPRAGAPVAPLCCTRRRGGMRARKSFLSHTIALNYIEFYHLPFCKPESHVETDEIETALMEHAGGIALQSGATSIEFRDMFRRTGDWPCRDEKLLMILELPAAPEELFKALGTKRRTRIRRARKENPEIRRGGIELLEDFYTVFAITMRDLGTPVYAPRFFREMLEAFPDKAQIVSIRLDGEPVSAGFLLGHGDMMQIPWAGTLRKANRLAMNMLLYWDIIENTIERGFARFDFGRTTVGSGTHEFKKQWGAQPHQMHWHYWVAPGQERPQLNPDNPRYKRAISIWQKLPVPVTRLIGPHLVKNLP